MEQKQLFGNEIPKEDVGQNTPDPETRNPLFQFSCYKSSGRERVNEPEEKNKTMNIRNYQNDYEPKIEAGHSLN